MYPLLLSIVYTEKYQSDVHALAMQLKHDIFSLRISHKDSITVTYDSNVKSIQVHYRKKMLLEKETINSNICSIKRKKAEMYENCMIELKHDK